jgi:TetR/AcrR family transcriptional repressor of lmrAB and yxaGH operons
MIETAARLFQESGYQATSWRTLVDEAGTPWGSAHHHFPGGKEQLGVAAIELGAAAVRARIEEAFAAADGPAQAARAWCRSSAESLAASGYVEGCPIATIALECTPRSPALAKACARAFESWRDTIHDRLVEAGFARKRARDLAMLMVVHVEGALVLARASRSKKALLLAGDHLGELLRR